MQSEWYMTCTYISLLYSSLNTTIHSFHNQITILDNLGVQYVAQGHINMQYEVAVGSNQWLVKNQVWLCSHIQKDVQVLQASLL